MYAFQDQMLKRVVGAGARFAGKIMPEVIEGYISMLELHLQSMREFKQVHLVIKRGSITHAIH